jgi:hypothetical protein
MARLPDWRIAQPKRRCFIGNTPRRLPGLLVGLKPPIGRHVAKAFHCGSRLTRVGQAARRAKLRAGGLSPFRADGRRALATEMKRFRSPRPDPQPTLEPLLTSENPLTRLGRQT